MKKIGFFLLIGSIQLLLGSVAVAVETGTSEKEGDESLGLTFNLTKSDYEYEIENRPDPFVPFFTGEATAEAELDPNEIIDGDQMLTGMQLFEPGQLTLVALLKSKGVFVAMVEDFTGKGYVIREGMKIGRRGVIKAIVPNKVLIEEVATTRAGKEVRSEIVMALRKEGEE